MTQEKLRRRSFTLDAEAYRKSLCSLSPKPRDKDMVATNRTNHYQRSSNPKLVNDLHKRAQSLKNKKNLKTPKIILPHETNKELDLKRYKADIEEEIKLSTIKLRSLSLTRLRNSNPELYNDINESTLSPTLFRTVRHASCGDLSTQFLYEFPPSKNLSIMQDCQMTSSNMNLDEINVRDTKARKKSKPQVLNIELRKRAIEARVKQRKRGETLKSLDDDFLKARELIGKYRSQECLCSPN